MSSKKKCQIKLGWFRRSEQYSFNIRLYLFWLSNNHVTLTCNCGVIQFKYATPSLAAHTKVCSNLSHLTSTQLPQHQIISYICHPTDVTAPEASCILLGTILIICLCAALSVTVGPLLHNVRSTLRIRHHFLYYDELCITLVCRIVHACVALQVGCEGYGRRMLMEVSATAS